MNQAATESTRLSVNINKVALLRNSRGGNKPDLLQVARDCESFGADGITVHPRPDERHIRFSDLQPLREINTTEFNIEGYPSEEFLEMVLKVLPHQCTLVPDGPDALTSDEGWDTYAQGHLLRDVVNRLRDAGIRTSIFINADPRQVQGALATGTDRIELYTGDFAQAFQKDADFAIANHRAAALEAAHLGLGVNAGHDLDLDNLRFYFEHIPNLLEVSIGHALIGDALYYGLENVIPMYQHRLRR